MNEIGPSDRPDLSQPPSGFTPAQPAAAPAPGQSSATPPPPPPQGTAQTSATPPPVAAGSFDMNQPTIISLLYISSFFLGVTGIVAVVLSYVWKGQPKAEWELSHYDYHARTFWIWLIGAVIGFPLLLAFGLGILVWLAVAVLLVVRSILALIKAQAHEPMPNPDTWLA